MDRFEWSPPDDAEDELTPQELQRLLARSSGVSLLDVRDVWEYQIAPSLPRY